MKFLILLAAVACASADVSHVVRGSHHGDESVAPIVRSDFDLTPEGSFQYAYETGNGIASQVQGVVKGNTEDAPLEVTGSVSYISPEGVPIKIQYVANENGYQPQGDHLPVAPPVPEAIARSLAYIASHPAHVEHPVVHVARVATPQTFQKFQKQPFYRN